MPDNAVLNVQGALRCLDCRRCWDVPEAAYYTPPLTTVHQDFSEVGRRSLAQLLARIANGIGELEHELVDPELVVRQTTAPPTRKE